MVGEPIRVLFVRTHNSARSQMAEALLRHLGGEAFVVSSAGTEPSRIHPLAIRAMAKLDLDIAAARSKHVAEFIGQDFDYIITVCDRAREQCPLFPADPERIH
jgi:arsenate reductase